MFFRILVGLANRQILNPLLFFSSKLERKAFEKMELRSKLNSSSESFGEAFNYTECLGFYPCSTNLHLHRVHPAHIVNHQSDRGANKKIINGGHPKELSERFAREMTRRRKPVSHAQPFRSIIIHPPPPRTLDTGNK